MDSTVMVTSAGLGLALVGAMVLAALRWSRRRDRGDTPTDRDVDGSPPSGDDEDPLSVRALRAHVLVLEQALTELAETDGLAETDEFAESDEPAPQDAVVVIPALPPPDGSGQANEDYPRRVAATIKVLQARIGPEESSAVALSRVSAAIARLDAGGVFARPSLSINGPEPTRPPHRVPVAEFRAELVVRAPVTGGPTVEEVAEDRAAEPDDVPAPESPFVLPVPPPPAPTPPSARRWLRRSAA